MTLSIVTIMKYYLNMFCATKSHMQFEVSFTIKKFGCDFLIKRGGNSFFALRSCMLPPIIFHIVPEESFI